VLYGVRPGSARDLAAQPSRTRGTWLKAFTSVTLRLAQSVAAERWQAVGLSAMLPTLVLTDCVGAAAPPGGTDAPWNRSARPSPGRTAGPRRRAARSARASAATRCTVILALADTLALDAAHRYLVTPMASPGSCGLEMDLLATGSAHAWPAALLAGGDRTALESAAGRGETLLAGGGALAPLLASDLADATGRVTRPPDPSLTDSSAIAQRSWPRPA
jgi:hypothetical protein